MRPQLSKEERLIRNRLSASGYRYRSKIYLHSLELKLRTCKKAFNTIKCTLHPDLEVLIEDLLTVL